MKELGNDNQITFIEVHKESPSNEIFYSKEKRNFFGKVIKKEGFYKYGKTKIGDLGIHQTIILLESIPSNIFINDKVAKEKAHLNIEYSSGRIKKLYFNTNQEMMLYVKREFQGSEWREFD